MKVYILEHLSSLLDDSSIPLICKIICKTKEEAEKFFNGWVKEYKSSITDERNNKNRH